ncbi:hypothetical protein [Pararhodobacter sp. SW119]|uniref:hypothetical protein n=1 Tax=Pararhodobacter sp. SW119 TaxID=2780075 RepID=UPI001ADFF9C0|nr:hypothetical protein [Pararhodobacter sp. SW119]
MAPKVVTLAQRSQADAVNLMGQQILGHDFEGHELDDQVAFLDALTGEMPRIEIPALP